ncbi:septum formation protein Maf [Candidatus Micrarchaeota archaeon CG1_02_55_22]|nr:MAG: septum formation protein Maf [Candidatus Micrarchaeota archaeon CG1_02_55_22]
MTQKYSETLMKIVFATTSPTRKAALAKIGVFEFIAPENVREQSRHSGSIEQMVIENALAKAEAVASQTNEIVIGLDTVAEFNGHAMGKPIDLQDARRMLNELSGEWHAVVTGIAVIDAAAGRRTIGVDKTRVKFKTLTSKQIDDYVATGEPLGKAAAYAIQEHARPFIETIEGSELNIVGVPFERLEEMLKEFKTSLR